MGLINGPIELQSVDLFTHKKSPALQKQRWAFLGLLLIHLVFIVNVGKPVVDLFLSD